MQVHLGLFASIDDPRRSQPLHHVYLDVIPASLLALKRYFSPWHDGELKFWLIRTESHNSPPPRDEYQKDTV
ncbi:hypothetical protein GMA8713_05060 [Grimontia marina]|uniref:Uncharacterized protein n=1 Tax=Grimontia marina TaxID=646534 RepID=A0A128FJP2_9GAMM|nr:hypothetical protein GMA8713_05060 [Grimontia marina]